MELRSGILKKFKKKFVLDEDSLRRLEGILKKSIDDYEGDLALVYRVEREDDRFFETTKIEDVLADPNVSGKKIDLLGIELREPLEDTQSTGRYKQIVVIAFDNEDDPPMFKRDVIFSISCSDRTWALLLADEIEPQIERLFKSKQTPRLLLLLLAIPLIPIFLRLLAQMAGASFEFRQGAILTVLGIIGIALIFFLGKYVGYPNWFKTYFGPESVFLWGEESSQYPDRENTRQNIKWGVIVAFLVSLATSIYVSFFL